MRARKQGFTLLELLTVMAIMVMVMGMTIVSYNALMRSSGVDGAVSDIRSSLSLARQFAVTRRCRTHVMFWQNGTNSNFQVCVEEGQQMGTDNTQLEAAFDRWTDDGLVGSDVYNFSTRKHGPVTENQERTLVASDAVSGGTLRWYLGDKYGWAIGNQSRLDDGVMFGADGDEETPPNVVFRADGTTEAGVSGGSNYTIKVSERHVDEPIDKTITVDALTGIVRVE